MIDHGFQGRRGGVIGLIKQSTLYLVLRLREATC
jgi:hypothetical protein